MARPIKRGLDYFSHDVTMSEDRKIKLLEKKCGYLGYAVYVKLLEQIFKADGYFLEYDREELECIFELLEWEEIETIIGVCLERKLFDLSMFEKYKILTSRRVQENYFSGILRRANTKIIKKFLIIEKSEKNHVDNNSVNVNNNGVIVDNNSVNVDNNSVNVDRKYTKERKGKERKEKERKVEERKEKNLKDFYPPAFSSFSSLSEEQKEWLKTTISMTPDFRLSPEELFELGNRNFEYIRKQFLDFKKKGATKFYSALKYGWIEEGGYIAEKPIEWRETE